jgi:hypothetical protein
MNRNDVAYTTVLHVGSALPSEKTYQEQMIILFVYMCTRNYAYMDTAIKTNGQPQL